MILARSREQDILKQKMGHEKYLYAAKEKWNGTT
jgi:hypothetical protein